MTQLSPGEKLRELLAEIYPYDDRGRSIIYIERMDYDFAADGEMLRFTYQSSLNYLVRRLITLSVYIYKVNSNNLARDYRREIENHLQNYTRLNPTQIKSISKILSECVQAVNKSGYEKRKVIEHAKNRRFYCFTCGTSLNFEDEESWNYATVDHLWPRSMGGHGEIDNLKAVCKSCNNSYKENYIDASDFHYEEIALTCISYEEYVRERERQYELAVLAKTNYKCAICDSPAHYIGELRIGRIDPKDSWHFHNLQAYCSRHFPKYD